MLGAEGVWIGLWFVASVEGHSEIGSNAVWSRLACTIPS
jgi:hypothetical protein